jgi:NAD(P)-dependent dehydrogenase (short-subunit alcohol dehydrogenase family)
MAGDQTLILSGKRAVVTGAGRGIRRSIALALANAGADVAVTARTGAARASPGRPSILMAAASCLSGV